MSALMQAQLRLSLAILLGIAVRRPRQPADCCSSSSRPPATSTSACPAALAGPRRAGLPRRLPRRPDLRAPCRADRARVLRPRGAAVSIAQAGERSSPSRIVCVRHPRGRVPSGCELSRTTSDFYVASRSRQRRLERLRDRRRVPLCCVVPRRRRPCLRARRRHALVPRRLHRRLSGAAGPRRRSAAPIGRLHAPRLRRDPPRVAPGPPALLPAGRRHRLALPAAPVPGRRPRPAARSPAPRPRRRLIVAVVVLANVAAGGMRSITLVQAMQYWLKLTAICDPGLRPARPLAGTSGAAGPNVAPTGGCRLGAGAQRLRRTRPSRLRDVLDAPGPVLRHHGAAARAGPLLHQPRRPRGPSYHARRGRAARALLPVHTGLRRPRSGLPPDPARRRAARTPWHCCCRSVIAPGLLGTVLLGLLAGGAFAAFLSTASGSDHLGRGRHRPGLPGPHHRPSRRRRRPRAPHLPHRGRGRGRRPVRRRAGSRSTPASPTRSAWPSRWPRRRSAPCWCSASGGGGLLDGRRRGGARHRWRRSPSRRR